MKDEKEKLSGKRAVTCTPVDWNEYKVKKEEQSAAKKSRKEKKEWEAPEVDEKWAVDKKDLKMPADPEMKELKADNRPSKRKSLNAKLNELGNSNWVSTGNFRSEEDKGLDRLEDKIINEASGSQDEFLKSAMKVVSDALNEEGSEGKKGKGIRADGLPEDGGVADTFEIPKLDIHFGDTAELKDIRQEIETIEKANIDKIVRERDLEAAIESQTVREITEREDNDRLAELENEGRKKKSKSRSKSKTGEEPEKRAKESADDEEVPVKRSKRRSSAAKEEGEGLPLDEDEAKPAKTSKSTKSTKGTKKKSSRTKDPDKVVIKSDEVSEEEMAAAAAAKRRKSKSGKTASGSAEKSKTGTKSSSKSGKKSSSKRSSRQDDEVVRKSAGSKGTKKKSSRSAAAEKYRKADKQAALDTVFDRKDGPSDFRKKSADWRDEDTVKKAERISLIAQKRQELSARIKKITPLQWGMAAMALVIFITGIMTSAVYANYQGEQNKASAIASLNKYTEDDSYREVATSMTEEMLPEAMDEPETTVAKVLSLEMSSVEKDLKIKLVDEEDTLVKDVSWSVTVAEEGDEADGEVYEDDDRDGTIYITDIAAGDYSVTLNPSDSLSDYILPQDKQLVSVKATIEYKVIANIKDEIKSEKEVNVALEDPNGNQAADVETGTALADTVEWVESTKTSEGEEYVEATPDLSKLAATIKKESGVLTALNRLGSSARKSLL
ncbi:MAG: hypothetical protein K6E63_03375, partial [Lachnospiraceae bacterium]|nr:hypothetical protein [Lachnospiraceae bacterium]